MIPKVRSVRRLKMENMSAKYIKELSTLPRLPTSGTGDSFLKRKKECKTNVGNILYEFHMAVACGLFQSIIQRDIAWLHNVTTHVVLSRLNNRYLPLRALEKLFLIG